MVSEFLTDGKSVTTRLMAPVYLQKRRRGGQWPPPFRSGNCVAAGRLFRSKDGELHVRDVPGVGRVEEPLRDDGSSMRTSM